MSLPPLAKSRKVLAFAVFVGLLLLSWLSAPFLLHRSPPTLPSLTTLSSYRLTTQPLIPRHIYQTWLSKDISSPTSPPPDLLSYVRTWPGRNPGYAHSLLSDADATSYIATHYSSRPEIASLFASLTIPVLRADLIRYLVLHGSGGIYTDLDTECYKSIDLWTGPVDNRRVGMIIGLEYDQRDDENRMGGTAWRVQFSQWTIAARRGHPVMRQVLETVVERLLEVERQEGGIKVENQGDVLGLTGPRVFTEAIRQGISAQMGREVDYAEFSMLPAPRLFGDVLVLPINGFASGVPHSGAGDQGNEESLVTHHFKGVWKEGLEDS